MWIFQLYEVLHPPVYLLGSLAQFNPSLIPNYARCLERLKVWIRELVYNLSPLNSQFFITDLLSSLNLILTFDKPEFNTYLYRAKFLRFPPIPDYLRGPYCQYVISDAMGSLTDEYDQRDSLIRGILFSK